MPDELRPDAVLIAAWMRGCALSAAVPEDPIQAIHDLANAIENGAPWEEYPAVRLAECALSHDGRHHVDTSMESGPNNCFHCEEAM